MKLFLNVNETIKVKIKPEGYQYMADRHNKLIQGILHLKAHSEGYQYMADRHNKLIQGVLHLKAHSAEYYEMNADEEGYTKIQMHEFMAIFGSFCEGSHIVPFETEILIEKPV